MSHTKGGRFGSPYTGSLVAFAAFILCALVALTLPRSTATAVIWWVLWAVSVLGIAFQVWQMGKK